MTGENNLIPYTRCFFTFSTKIDSPLKIKTYCVLYLVAMHLTKDDQERLLQQASYFINGKGLLEWEMVFGRNTQQQTYYGPIHKGVFQAIIRRLKALPQLEEQAVTESLDISVVPKSSRGTNHPIRLTLEGRPNIMAFCREDSSLLEHLKLTYKSRNIPGLNPEDSHVDIPDYGLRANLKSEISLNWETQDGSEAAAAKDALAAYLKENGGLYRVPKTVSLQTEILLFESGWIPI